MEAIERECWHLHKKDPESQGGVYSCLRMVGGGSLAAALQAVLSFLVVFGFEDFRGLIWEAGFQAWGLYLVDLAWVVAVTGFKKPVPHLRVASRSQELQEARQQLRNVLSRATAEDSHPAGGGPARIERERFPLPIFANAALTGRSGSGGKTRLRHQPRMALLRLKLWSPLTTSLHRLKL